MKLQPARSLLVELILRYSKFTSIVRFVLCNNPKHMFTTFAVALRSVVASGSVVEDVVVLLSAVSAYIQLSFIRMETASVVPVAQAT